MDTYTLAQKNYDSARRAMLSAEAAFDGSPASIAWVRDAVKKLADAQRELMAERMNAAAEKH